MFFFVVAFFGCCFGLHDCLSFASALVLDCFVHDGSFKVIVTCGRTIISIFSTLENVQNGECSGFREFCGGGRRWRYQGKFILAGNDLGCYIAVQHLSSMFGNHYPYLLCSNILPIHIK